MKDYGKDRIPSSFPAPSHSASLSSTFCSQLSTSLSVWIVGIMPNKGRHQSWRITYGKRGSINFVRYTDDLNSTYTSLLFTSRWETNFLTKPLLIHFLLSLNKYLRKVYHVPDTILDIRIARVNKTGEKSLPSCGLL